MSITKILGIGVGALLVIALSYAAYMGGFKSVEVSEVQFEETEIIFSTHKGSYSKLAESWKTFITALVGAGFTKCEAIAVYLDSPEVPEDKLRTIIGCKTKNVPAEALENIKQTFSTFVIPTSESFRSAFTYKNRLSYMIGPMKTYPKIQKVIESKGMRPTVAIEDYGHQEVGKDIQYYMPVNIEQTVFGPLYDAFEK